VHHHLWSETRQTGYSVGVTVRLESPLSALDLFGRVERVRERRSSNRAAKDHPEEIARNLHGRFCINSCLVKLNAVSTWRATCIIISGLKHGKLDIQLE